MSFSDYVSLFAVTISILSLYISWRQYSRDNSKLKLRLNFLVKSGQGSSYTLIVNNAGRRPVTIYKCYARLKSGKTYPVYDQQRILEETDYFEVDIPLFGFRNTITHPLDIISFGVEDTVGRIKWIKTKTIKQDILDSWKPEVDWLQKA